jgi:hypothetical protein
VGSSGAKNRQPGFLVQPNRLRFRKMIRAGHCTWYCRRGMVSTRLGAALLLSQPRPASLPGRKHWPGRPLSEPRTWSNRPADVVGALGSPPGRWADGEPAHSPHRSSNRDRARADTAQNLRLNAACPRGAGEAGLQRETDASIPRRLPRRLPRNRLHCERGARQP